MAGNNANQRTPLSASQSIKMESGIVNHGLDYECRVITYIAMLLNNMDSVVDFTIYTSPFSLKPIDDIVAEIRFKDDKGCEKAEIWLMQIKHKEGKNLRYYYSPQSKPNNDSQTENIDLVKYVKVYEGLDDPSNSTTDKTHISYYVRKRDVAKILFFTNAKPMMTNSSTVSLPFPLTKANSSDWSQLFTDLVRTLGNDKCMKCSDRDKLVCPDFLNKFYTFVLQPNVEQILQSIERIDMMKGFSKPMVEQVCNLVEKQMSALANIGRCTKLTKTDLRDICLTTVVKTRIIGGLRTCTRIKAQKQYADIWADIFNKYQVVQLNPQSTEDNERLLQNIAGYYQFVIQRTYDPKFDWDYCFQDCFQLNETIKKKVRNAFTLADLLLHMWKFDKLPLVIDESINNLFFRNVRSTSLDKQFTGCYFVIAKPGQFSQDVKHLGQISNLPKDDPIYKEIINLEISVQGRKPVPLGKVFEDMGLVTATQLLLWTGQEKKCERLLYQKKCNVTRSFMLNSYDRMSVEIYLDIEDDRKSDRTQKVSKSKTQQQIKEEQEKKDKEMKEKEIKEKEIVSETCKNILNQAIREGDFLVWKGEQDDCKLSKTRTIFDHKYNRNGETMKVSFELEQKLLPEEIVQLCKTMSRNLDPNRILGNETGHNVLKWEDSHSFQSEIYNLSLNIFVTHHHETSDEENRDPPGELDYKMVQTWMDDKQIGIDDLVPKKIIIEQSLDIVPQSEYKIKGGKLKIFLHRKSEEQILQEIIKECVGVFNDEREKEDFYANLKIKISVPQIGNNLTAGTTNRTIIKRKFFPKPFYNIFSEDEIWSQNRKKRFVVISNKPGMGKTTVLKSIATRCNPEDYVLLYDLANYDRSLTDFKMNPVNQIFEIIKQKDDNLEELLFKHHLKNYRIKICLDSFDEILPAHKNDVLGLLENVLKEEMYTIVTTRAQAEDFLTERFNDVSEIVSLRELNNLEVQMFCKKENIDATHISKFPKRFLNIPLHLEMLRGITKMENNEYEREKEFELSNFYEQFIDLKVDIFIKKNKLTGNALQQLRITNKEQMYDDLYDLSVVCIFGRENTEDIIDDDTFIRKVNDFKKYVFPLGILCDIHDIDVRFTHRSYAEYLAAKWFCKKLNMNRQVDPHVKKLYNKILENNELVLLNFLNDISIMTEGCKLHKAIKNRDKQQVQHILENEAWNHVNKPDLIGRYPIDVAAGLLSNSDKERNDYFEISKMLFNKLPENELYKEHNSILQLHFAATVGDIDRLKYFMENARTHRDPIMHVVYTVNYDGWNILHLAAYYGHTEIVQYLVEDINMNPSVVTTKLIGRNAWELAERSRADMDTKNTIISVLIDNGCLTSKILLTSQDDMNPITKWMILELAQTLSTDSKCRDFEIMINLPYLSMFNNIFVLYTSQDKKKTGYFVDTTFYEMNLIFDENVKAGDGDIVIPLEDCQNAIQNITNYNFDPDWEKKLTNINKVFCMYTKGTLQPQTTVETEMTPLRICSKQEVYRICSEDQIIFVYTNTELEADIEFTRYTDRYDFSTISTDTHIAKINNDVLTWMSPMIDWYYSRPLTDRVFELICLKHMVFRYDIYSEARRFIHPDLVDQWVQFFHDNQLIYMDDDDDLVALLSGYFLQCFQQEYERWTSIEYSPMTLYLDEFKDWCRGSYPDNTYDRFNYVRDFLLFFTRHPLLIKLTWNLDNVLRKCKHLKKHLIVIIDKECPTPREIMCTSHLGVPELVESIKRVTNTTITPPYTMSKLLRASEGPNYYTRAQILQKVDIAEDAPYEKIFARFITDY